MYSRRQRRWHQQIDSNNDRSITSTTYNRSFLHCLNGRRRRGTFNYINFPLLLEITIFYSVISVEISGFISKSLVEGYYLFAWLNSGLWFVVDGLPTGLAEWTHSAFDSSLSLTLPGLPLRRGVFESGRCILISNMSRLTGLPLPPSRVKRVERWWREYLSVIHIPSRNS